MINHDLKCIFVEIPKTASTSIREVVGHPIKPHLNIGQIHSQLVHEARFGDQTDPLAYANHIINSYFKFTIVRNPWDRVVSLYARREGIQASTAMSFEHFVERLRYSSDTCIHPTPHRYQLDWLRDQHNTVNIDFVGRFENLAEDWQTIKRHLGLDIELPHANHNPEKKQHYSTYYNAQTQALIAEKFATDIDYFDYAFTSA